MPVQVPKVCEERGQFRFKMKSKPNTNFSLKKLLTHYELYPDIGGVLFYVKLTILNSIRY